MKVHQTIIGSVNRLWYFMHRKAEITALQQAFWNFRSRNSQVVVLSQSKPDENTNENYSSRGVGRTRLLKEFLVSVAGELPADTSNPQKITTFSKSSGKSIWDLTISDMDKSNKRLEIVAFLDLKHQLLESSTPFHHLFVNTLFEKGHTSLSSQDLWLISKLWFVRFLLLFRLSYLLIIGILTSISLFTGLAADIGIAPTLQAIQTWIGSNIIGSILILVFLIIITYWNYWKDPNNSVKSDWNAYPSPKDVLQKTLVTDNPVNIAQVVNQHLSKNKDYLFVIDDAEKLPLSSYDVINAIFDEMVKTQKNIMIIWAYDLNKPKIHKTEDRKFRDISNLKARNKLIIEMHSVLYLEILEIMRGRYGRRSGSPKKFLDSLLDNSWVSRIAQDEYKTLSLAGRLDLIFGFLEYLEKNNRIRSRETNFDAFTKITVWDIDEINFPEQFSLYLAKDELAAEKILKQIEGLGQVGKDCLEIIKCLVAFPNAAAQKEHLLTVTMLDRQVFNSCISKLITEIKLLVETDQRYEFAQQEQKLMLWATSWKTWNQDKKYSEKIFYLFLEDDDPVSQSQLANLALYCNASRETLDVLLKKGKYLANDLGYLDLALDFLAADNGALDQWISLLQSARTKGESLLRLPEWHYTAITNFDPSEHTKDTSTYNVSALELCKEIVRIYWLLGKLEIAESIISRKWLIVKNLLTDLSDTSFGSRIITLDDALNFDLAEIHLQLGSWDKALEICGKIEIDSQQRSSYYRDHFSRIQSLISLYRLTGVNTEKSIVTISASPSSEIVKKEKETIKEYREQVVRPVPINESSRTHGLRLSNRQLLLAMHWSNENAQNELSKTIAEAISSFTASGRSLLSDGRILASSAILYFIAFLKAQRLESVINRLEYIENINYDPFGNPLYYPRSMSTDIDPITGEIVETSEEYKEPSEEERWAFNSEQAEEAITKIKDAVENWSRFLTIIDDHIVNLKIECNELCDQTSLKIASAKTAPLQTREGSLKSATTELKTKLLSLFVGLRDYLKDHSQQGIDNAFTIFDQLGYSIGLAELYHLSAFLADKESGARKDKKEKEGKLAEKIENIQKGLEIRENLQIKFRCAEGYFELAKHFEKSGHYPLAGKYYELSGDHCLFLSFPVLQAAEAYANAGLIYFNTSSVSNHERLSLRASEKALGMYLDASKDPNYGDAPSKFRENILFVKRRNADLYRRLKEFDRAIQICDQLIEECQNATDSIGTITLGRTYDILGSVSLDRDGSIAAALSYYEKAYLIFDTQKDMFWKLSSLHGLVNMSIDRDWNRFEKYFPLLEAIYRDYKKSGGYAGGGAVISLGNASRLLGDILLRGIKSEKSKSDEAVNSIQDISAITYFEESIDCFIKVGEYYPAIGTARRLLDQWKDGKYDGKALAQKLTDLVSILDIDPNNGTSMSALDDVYQIFNHLIKSVSISTLPSEKQECLQKAKGLFDAKRFKDAIPFLEKGHHICQSEEARTVQSGHPHIPDGHDILIYQRLYETYQQLNMLKEKQAFVMEFQHVRSRKVSANLLELGEYYEAQNIFSLAIRMYYLAGNQKPDSYFAQRARQRREFLCEKIGGENSPYCK